MNAGACRRAAARPVILNGIEDVITRLDLADRALFLTLPSISEAHRRPEKELWQEFELARPSLLGALLDAVSQGLRTLPQVRLNRLPRMADFAIWAAGCETALWPTGAFARAYEANRRAALDGVIDADPVASWVREIMAERSAWTGCAADLLRTAAGLATNGASRGSPGWPKNPRALAGRLRRVQTALRTLGIEIAFSREGRAGTRIIRMSKAPENTVSTDNNVGSNRSRSGQRHPTRGASTSR